MTAISIAATAAHCIHRWDSAAQAKCETIFSADIYLDFNCELLEFSPIDIGRFRSGQGRDSICCTKLSPWGKTEKRRMRQKLQRKGAAAEATGLSASGLFLSNFGFSVKSDLQAPPGLGSTFAR